MKTHSNDLPQESQNNVLPALSEDMRVHIDHMTTNCFGRSDSQSKVLMSLKQRKLGAFVNNSGVNGIRNSKIDQGAEKYSG